MDRRFSRRQVMVATVFASPGILLAARQKSLARPGSARYQASNGTPTTAAPTPVTPVATIDALQWKITILSFQDPYIAELRTPASPVPNMPSLRYIGAELLFENTSEEPLGIRTSAFHVHDADGFDYAPAAGVSSPQPKLQSQTVQGGERARGWLFFAVPSGAELTELRMDEPAAEMKVPLQGIANLPAPQATPQS
jgi:hypothetical protein